MVEKKAIFMSALKRLLNSEKAREESVRIYDLRKELGWVKTAFDEVLRELRQKDRVISLSDDPVGKPTKREIAGGFIDRDINFIDIELRHIDTDEDNNEAPKPQEVRDFLKMRKNLARNRKTKEISSEEILEQVVLIREILKSLRWRKVDCVVSLFSKKADADATVIITDMWKNGEIDVRISKENAKEFEKNTGKKVVSGELDFNEIEKIYLREFFMILELSQIKLAKKIEKIEIKEEVKEVAEVAEVENDTREYLDDSEEATQELVLSWIKEKKQQSVKEVHDKFKQNYIGSFFGILRRLWEKNKIIVFIDEEVLKELQEIYKKSRFVAFNEKAGNLSIDYYRNKYSGYYTDLTKFLVKGNV